MESNSCDVEESDVLLPPRKRLLAGLKRQSSPGSSVSNSSLHEFEMRINHLFKNYTTNSDVSNEEILDASRNAAFEAIKFAEVARAAAEEKAAKAVKAVAAAKTALELVAKMSENTDYIDTYIKKIKINMNGSGQSLHNKQKGANNYRNDEELARNLHRAMNSSGRVSKNSLTLNPKTPSPSKKHKLCTGGTPTKSVDLEVSAKVLSVPKSKDGDQLMVNQDNPNAENGELETIQSNQRRVESPDDTSSKGGKKKHKQKILPLSICNLRDQVNLKDDMKSGNLPVAGEEKSKAIGDSLGSVERTSLWKCQAFKSPTTGDQNKVTQL